jgi:hypothetical protein
MDRSLAKRRVEKKVSRQEKKRDKQTLDGEVVLSAYLASSSCSLCLLLSPLPLPSPHLEIQAKPSLFSGYGFVTTTWHRSTTDDDFPPPTTMMADIVLALPLALSSTDDVNCDGTASSSLFCFLCISPSIGYGSPLSLPPHLPSYLSTDLVLAPKFGSDCGGCCCPQICSLSLSS